MSTGISRTYSVKVWLKGDAYTHQQLIDILEDKADLGIGDATEAIINAVSDSQLIQIGDYYFPACVLEYQVIFPRIRWSTGSLRAWIMRGFDRVYAIVPELEGTEWRRKYVQTISEEGANQLITDLSDIIEYTPSVRFPGRPYRMNVNRFYTCFGIDQPVVFRYTGIVAPPPIERRYAGHIRWACGAKKVGGKNIYRFIREITVFHDTLETDPDRLETMFTKLLDCVLSQINYPDIEMILGSWNSSSLGGALQKQFEVTRVAAGSPGAEHPDGFWEYVEFDANTQDRLNVVNAGEINPYDCLLEKKEE